MIVALVILAVVAALLVAVMLWVRRAVRRSQRTLQAALAGRPVVAAENALSLGVASRGKRQLRGSGTLALCHDRVLFVQWAPSSVLEILFADITRVDTTKVHLGKSVGARLLRISWMTPDGGDEIAFQVRDVDHWLAALPSVAPRGE
jgi:hypothetical protein